MNVDARGSFNSQGDIHVYGTQEGRDGYDTIEWIAEQRWWISSTCWELLAGDYATVNYFKDLLVFKLTDCSFRFIAAESPPHLKCMAPWEGLGDYYRESICRGGIPDHAFWDALFTFFGGNNHREDVSGMVDEHPLWNSYWEDKKAKLSKVNVPLYAIMSYSTGLHTEGSLRGFLLSASTEKWLRIHTMQEWHDLYQPENIDDLQKFLDHFMVSANNGWQETPNIRL